MTLLSRVRRATVPALAMLLVAASFPAFAQDEAQQFNAFAVVQAKGTIVKTGEKQSMIVAALSGAFFVETDEGPVPSGSIACPAMVRVDLDSSRQTGSGACTFTALDGATSWGEWQCEGYNLVGCRGPFKLNGGTGRLEGLTGEATMIWRPSAREIQKQLDGSELANATGILIWRDFKLTKK
jgi:hypothetical protein